MSNDYFDSYSSLPRDQLARAEAVNAIFDAIIVGFNRLPSMASLKEDRVTYATDTGTANAYVIAPTYAIAAYTAGQSFRFLAVHANTAASTVNVSSLGVKTIKRPDGNDLASGDITANRLITLQYDGTYFQLVTPAGSDVAASAASATAAAASATASAASNTSSGNSATASAASAAIASAAVVSIAGTVSQWAVAAGTADAITATFPVTVTSLTDGLVLGFRASAANATATPTFKADGTTAHTITKQGGAALVAGDIKGALAEYIVRYNLANTRWELLAPSMPYGATTGSGSVVLSTSPVLVTPALGTPASGVLTNCTGLPNGGLLNASVTIGSTPVALGATVATFAGVTLTAPVLGAATATSINKVAFTAPASSATVTIADGKTFTANNTIALSGTDSTTLNINAIGTLNNGSHTPTGAGLANVSAITPQIFRWTRMGNYVTSSGFVDVTASSAAAVTVEFTLTLPVASDLTVTTDLVGVFTNNDDNRAGYIQAITATDKADCYFTSSSTSSRRYAVIYTYEVK